MAPRKSTSPAPRRRSSRPSLGTTPKKFTYSAIGETTVDADEKAAALDEAALLKAREARVARDNAEADAAETGPLYLAMGQAAAISAAGEAFCALAIKGESLDAYRLGVFASFSALLTAAIMPWLAVLAQAEMHPLMKTAVDSASRSRSSRRASSRTSRSCSAAVRARRAIRSAQFRARNSLRAQSSERGGSRLRAGLSAIPMKLMDDYPERVVVGFAFWPFVSLLNFTLVRPRARTASGHRATLRSSSHVSSLSPALQVPRRFHLLVLNLAGFLWGVSRPIWREGEEPHTACDRDRTSSVFKGALYYIT